MKLKTDAKIRRFLFLSKKIAWFLSELLRQWDWYATEQEMRGWKCRIKGINTILKIPKIFLKWRAKSPQKVAFRMPFHYFSPFISLLFTNPKVTNCPAIHYFFTYFPCSMVKLVYFEISDLGIKKWMCGRPDAWRMLRRTSRRPTRWTGGWLSWSWTSCMPVSVTSSLARGRISRLIHDHLIEKIREERGTTPALYHKTDTIIL